MNKSLKNQIQEVSHEIDSLGFSSKYTSRTQRLINRNGTFNVERRGLTFSETFNLYHWLISLHWFKFLLLASAAFLIVNIIFALLYYINGVENLGTVSNSRSMGSFLEAFFFSTQTLTTVGYGRINPLDTASNIIASIESTIGLLVIAIAAGLLYGRFSKPFARIIYSKYALISPFQDKTGFMFRTANKQKSQIIDAEVQIVFSRLEKIDGVEVRKFYSIKPEYSKINFFSSTWTVNHPIDESSPLFGMTEEDFHKSEAEFLILLKGFDDSFAQNVHSRFSYRHDEIIWGAKFKNVHLTDGDGKFFVALDKISEYEKFNLNT